MYWLGRSVGGFAQIRWFRPIVLFRAPVEKRAKQTPATAAGREVAMYSTALRNTAPPEHGRAFFAYVAVVCAVALAFVIPAVPELRDVPEHSPAPSGLLPVLAVGADLRPFPPPGRQRSVVFPSICFTFAIMLMWGFEAAVVVQTAAVIASAITLQHRPWRAA